MPQPLFNPNDGLTGRDGGPYLDQEEMKAAEVRRAQVEDREPDFDNLQPTAGVPLVTAAQLVQGYNVAAVPSQAHSTAYADAVKKGAESDDVVTANPVAEGPTAEELDEAARNADENNPDHSANPFAETPNSDDESVVDDNKTNEGPVF